jgi:hypothetical protein
VVGTKSTVDVGTNFREVVNKRFILSTVVSYVKKKSKENEVKLKKMF